MDGPKKCDKCGAIKVQRYAKNGTRAGFRCRRCEARQRNITGVLPPRPSIPYSPLSMTEEELAQIPTITDKDRSVLAWPHKYTENEVRTARRHEKMAYQKLREAMRAKGMFDVSDEEEKRRNFEAQSEEDDDDSMDDSV